MEILFRGKPDIDQEWLEEMELTLDEYMENLVSANYKDGFVYGQVVYSGKQPYIVGEVVESTDEWITLEYWIPVKPETVGQLIRKGSESRFDIYTGDILQDDWGYKYAIEWDEQYTVYWARSIITGELKALRGKWAIGTEYDNPELLEVD